MTVTKSYKIESFNLGIKSRFIGKKGSGIKDLEQKAFQEKAGQLKFSIQKNSVTVSGNDERSCDIGIRLIEQRFKKFRVFAKKPKNYEESVNLFLEILGKIRPFQSPATDKNGWPIKMDDSLKVIHDGIMKEKKSKDEYVKMLSNLPGRDDKGRFTKSKSVKRKRDADGKFVNMVSWHDDNKISNLNKRQMLELLRANAPKQILDKYKLNGQEKSIVKKTNMAHLRSAIEECK